MIRRLLKKSITWYHDESGLAPSSAQTLRKRAPFKTPGDTEGLSEFYGRLNRKLPPDFDAIADVLAALPAVQPNDQALNGVIIETRPHKNCALVLENFIAATGMPVQVFHGTENGDFLRQCLPDQFRDQISLIEMPIQALDAACYNALVMSEAFWNALAGRQKILVFQTDALACAGSPYSINDFMGFDYIGSRWRRTRRVGLVCDGGNGGLSLRDWAASVACLKRFPAQAWPAGEDGYFAFHLDVMGYRVGRRRDCARFGSQHTFEDKSWGVHKPGVMAPGDLEAFLNYYPEARHLI